jgi:hypothetical protein
MVAARTAAEWRAAADIELGYPLNRDPAVPAQHVDCE